MIGRRAPFLTLALAVLLGACAAPALPSPIAGSATPTLPSPGASVSPGPSATASPDRSPDSTASPKAGACSEELVQAVREAVDGVEAYSYRAQGFVFQPVFYPDPLATPATQRVETAFEGAYQAPDRASLDPSGDGSAPGSEATVSIGRDLYVETVSGWVKLPDATDPDVANVLAGLLEDAGGDWVAETAQDASCRLVAGQRLPGGSGERRTVLVVEPGEALPSRLELDVTGAVGRNGEINDLSLVYLFRYDPAPSIEPPI